MKTRNDVQTIEKTSKVLKAALLGAIILACLGMFIVFIEVGSESDPVIGMTLLLVGIFGFLTIKTLTWWHHG